MALDDRIRYVFPAYLVIRYVSMKRFTFYIRQHIGRLPSLPSPPLPPFRHNKYDDSILTFEYRDRYPGFAAASARPAWLSP